MSNEILCTVREYFRDEAVKSIYFYGNQNGVKFAIDILQHGDALCGDAPDLVVYKDDILLIVEHFEFDCFKSSRKGSKNRREQSYIEKRFSESITNEIHRDTIHGESSYSNYIYNCTKHFKHHYQKVGRYIDNVIAKGYCDTADKVRVAFLIDDVSPLGSFAFDDNKGCVPVLLAHSPEFIDLLSQSPDVDFVIACSCVGMNKFVWCIDLSELSFYKEHTQNYKTMFFPDMNNVQVIGSNIRIPKGR